MVRIVCAKFKCRVRQKPVGFRQADMFEEMQEGRFYYAWKKEDGKKAFKKVVFTDGPVRSPFEYS